MKKPRAKYTDAFIVKCMANKQEGSLPVLLLKALVHTSTPHKAVDSVLGMPEGSTHKYLLTGELPEGILESQILDTTVAVARLISNNAFSPRGLEIGPVLRSILDTKYDLPIDHHSTEKSEETKEEVLPDAVTEEPVVDAVVNEAEADTDTDAATDIDTGADTDL